MLRHFFFFFQIFDLGNIFENFDQKCQKMPETWFFGKKSCFFFFFFYFFVQNVQKYCLIQNLKIRSLSCVFYMAFKQF